MNNNMEQVAIKFHPRAFSAFGSDLVTNDCVAIAELVKNGYDAFATRVCVSVFSDYIEIRDNGLGMTRDIIRNAWAVIATPYKEKRPVIEVNGRIRRVSGNKGLGRFSAARLGRYLEIITKNVDDQYVTAKIDWESFTKSESMNDCQILMTASEINEELEGCGTIIRITGLYETWDDKKITELINALARLISPFEKVDDFSIELNYEAYATSIHIMPQEFIQKPTYSICGSVTSDGDIEWKYKYAPRACVVTQKDGKLSWEDASRGFESMHVFQNTPYEEYKAGKFSFEIRAWDLDSDSIAEVSDTFKIGKREIRNNIAQYKGLSIYRDNVLVLPKSDATKDWLGIDIRRVSQIGRRLSTSQIIGMVNISSEYNREIKDTTDREKLVDTVEYKQFCRIVESVIVTFENLRYIDKTPTPATSGRKGLNDLISPLSTVELVSKLEDAVSEGHNAQHLLETVRDYAAESEKALSQLNDRLTYYAQTASLGSVAVVILHEILTGMTVIKRFLKRFRNNAVDADARTIEYLEDAETWHSRLVDVANSFAPLYRRTLKNEEHSCNLLDEINKSIRLVSSKKEAHDITFEVDVSSAANVSVHAGELQTILVNLLDNAIFWINYAKKDSKKISIRNEFIDESKIKIVINDTGLGIQQDEADKIFQPGITSKPHGIGMGLVIVTELLNHYDCKVGTVVPGELGGATFIFELPRYEDGE